MLEEHITKAIRIRHIHSVTGRIHAEPTVVVPGYCMFYLIKLTRCTSYFLLFVSVDSAVAKVYIFEFVQDYR